MASTDMSPFMGENRGILGLVVALGEYDVVHPTERRYVKGGYADDGAVGLWMLLAATDE